MRFLSFTPTPKLPLYTPKELPTGEMLTEIPPNYSSQPAPHTATDGRTDSRVGAFPQACRERHLPEIHEGAHALKNPHPSLPPSPRISHKRPACMPKFMEWPRKYFYPFRHLLKMHFVHIWQNSHLSDAHIKRIFSSALCESALFEEKYSLHLASVHHNANIHSREYNKQACQRHIFTPMHLKRDLWRHTNIKIW